MSTTEETRAVVERFIIEGEKDFPVTGANLEVFKTNLRALFEELVHPDIVLHGVISSSLAAPCSTPGKLRC